LVFRLVKLLQKHNQARRTNARGRVYMPNRKRKGRTR
jgi:hypothetical protein